MKDLEKIKSEDLGCQVQDANPGNFGIEQEVAAMVGATVPAPTEPSADDARELGAQLLVFLRRALLPIRSALRTALADIYSYLDSRCTDYTPAAYASYIPRPYDPMGTPPTPRTLPNLLTAITAFAARKISNGSAPNDGIPDGVSLAHLLLSATQCAAVTKIVDDNRWNADSKVDYTSFFSFFPNLQKFVLGAEVMDGAWYKVVANKESLTEFEAPNLRVFGGVPGGTWEEMWLIKGCSMTRLDFPALEEVHTSATSGNFITNNSTIVEIYAPKLKDIRACSDNWAYRQYAYTSRFIQYCTALKILETDIELMSSIYDSYQKPFVGTTNLERLKFGKLKAWNALILCTDTDGSHTVMPNLIDLEIGQGTDINLDFKYWNPTDKGTTFLQNFKEHIALRLTDQGSGLTLTLSQAVFDTIWNQDGTPKSTDPDSVIYQINKIIKTDKHWSVNRA